MRRDRAGRFAPDSRTEPSIGVLTTQTDADVALVCGVEDLDEYIGHADVNVRADAASTIRAGSSSDGSTRLTLLELELGVRLSAAPHHRLTERCDPSELDKVGLCDRCVVDLNGVLERVVRTLREVR